MQKNKFLLATLLILTFNVFNLAFAQDDTGPDITLKSNVSSVDAGKLLKVTANVTEPLLRFGATNISVDGGNIESVRKLSPYSYLIFVRAGDDSREVDLLVESSSIQNLKKVYNEYSSNNLIVKINPAPATPAPTDNSSTQISDLLNKVTDSINSAQQKAAQAAQSAQQVSYSNCYGQQIPSTQTCYPPSNSNPNIYNPYATQQVTTQPVYDPYTGTYYYPNTVTPVTPVYNSYTTSQVPIYDPDTDTYYYDSPVTTYPTYRPVVTPLTPVNPIIPLTPNAPTKNFFNGFFGSF